MTQKINQSVSFYAMCRIVVFLLLAVFYFAIPNARPDFTKFNANDSEHYLALSYSLVNGIGYTRSMDNNYFVPHTTWPPGVPILMMPAVAVSGEKISWLAVKITSSLIGLLGIIFVWCLIRRETRDEFGADFVALFVGLNPIYWDFSHQVMSEVPLTVWIISSLFIVDIVWRDRRVLWWEAFSFGSFIGMGMLIKGHAIGLIFSPLCYALHRSQEPLSRKNNLNMWFIFALGFAVPFVAWGIRNSITDAIGFDGLNQLRMLRAKNPVDPQSELLSIWDTITVVVKNFRHHMIHILPCEILPGLWNVKDWSLPGILALGLSVALGLLCLGSKRLQLAILSVILSISALNLVYAFGGAERFWIPVSILMTILISLRFWKWLVGRERAFMLICICVIGAVLTTNLIIYVLYHEKHPYSHRGAFKELAEFFDETTKMNLYNKNVLTTHQNAFKLMTGYKSPPISAWHKESKPYYDYVVLRVDGKNPSPPHGAIQRLEVYPYGLYELAKPTIGPELLSEEQTKQLPFPPIK
ncbi:MAG: glycosyltransferase family 39 protein [Anaerolineales bacterium]|nr:glycosyltransferase family 39 protein [Anaerolineales bacterium]